MLEYDPPLRDAKLSADGLYRYRLGRTWCPSERGVVWVMLNPSTADAHFDDPTIRRCVGFARSWGMGWITVVNLYAFRATYPQELERCADRWPARQLELGQ